MSENPTVNHKQYKQTSVNVSKHAVKSASVCMCLKSFSDICIIVFGTQNISNWEQRTTSGNVCISSKLKRDFANQPCGICTRRFVFLFVSVYFSHHFKVIRYCYFYTTLFCITFILVDKLPHVSN